MSQRQRGSEVSLVTLVDGVPQVGSFLKVQNFTLTPRTDLNEEGFLGEKTDDIDIQHHGYDIAFEVHNTNAVAIDFLNLVVGKEEDLESHPKITLQVFLAFRIPGVVGRSIILQDMFLKVDEYSASDRKDYTITRFSGKNRKQNTINN